MDNLTKHAIAKSEGFLICFNIVDKDSLLHVWERWAKMLDEKQRSFAILVGLKADLRKDEDVIWQYEE